MQIKVTYLTKDLLARIFRMDKKDVAALLEKYGREQAISEGLPAIAEEIWKNTQDKENHHLLFTQFKNKVFGDSTEIHRHGKEIHWSFSTNLFAMARENEIDDTLLYGFVLGYVKEVFEMLFDSFIEVQLSPQAPQSMITMTISPFDDTKQWLHTVLLELEKLDKNRAAAILEQCGRACGKSHGLTDLSKEFRDKVEDKNDLDRLFSLYKEKVCNNSTRLYKENGVIYLEYHSCGCPIVKDKAIDNPFFCNCTIGYTKERFETLFDRPVRVELLESIIRGDGRCRQAITIINDD